MKSVIGIELFSMLIRESPPIFRARFAHRPVGANRKSFITVIVCLAMIIIGGHWTSQNTWAQSSTADLAITSAVPSTATTGSFYTFTFTASGGTPPYSWEASLVSPDRTSGTTWFSSPWDEIINGMSFDSSSGEGLAGGTCGDLRDALYF